MAPSFTEFDLKSALPDLTTPQCFVTLRSGAIMHRCAQQHPLAAVFPECTALLNPPAIETAGDGDTPCVTASLGQDFRTRIGSVNRYIHDPSDWSQGRWIVPLGASGHPGSAHYADPQRMWANVETIPQLWDWDEIGRAAETEQQLKKRQDSCS